MAPKKRNRTQILKKYRYLLVFRPGSAMLVKVPVPQHPINPDDFF